MSDCTVAYPPPVDCGTVEPAAPIDQAWPLAPAGQLPATGTSALMLLASVSLAALVTSAGLLFGAHVRRPVVAS